jgi:glycerate kinase
MRLPAICFFAVALFASSAGAQQAVSTRGPTLQAAAVGFRVAETRVDKSSMATGAQIVRRHQGQDVALMAVGVGAMIVGALVSGTAGTIIVIGGAAVALFGLYHYLE